MSFNFQEKQYSLDDMLKICFDFYKSLDKNLYNKIIDLLRNENVDVIITEPSPKNKDKNSFAVRRMTDKKWLSIHQIKID